MSVVCVLLSQRIGIVCSARHRGGTRGDGGEGWVLGIRIKSIVVIVVVVTALSVNIVGRTGQGSAISPAFSIARRNGV